jgi:hypothetical protein
MYVTSAFFLATYRSDNFQKMIKKETIRELPRSFREFIDYSRAFLVTLIYSVSSRIISESSITNRNLVEFSGTLWIILELPVALKKPNPPQKKSNESVKLY